MTTLFLVAAITSNFENRWRLQAQVEFYYALPIDRIQRSAVQIDPQDLDVR